MSRQNPLTRRLSSFLTQLLDFFCQPYRFGSRQYWQKEIQGKFREFAGLKQQDEIYLPELGQAVLVLGDYFCGLNPLRRLLLTLFPSGPSVLPREIAWFPLIPDLDRSMVPSQLEYPNRESGAVGAFDIGILLAINEQLSRSENLILWSCDYDPCAYLLVKVMRFLHPDLRNIHFRKGKYVPYVKNIACKRIDWAEAELIERTRRREARASFGRMRLGSEDVFVKDYQEYSWEERVTRALTEYWMTGYLYNGFETIKQREETLKEFHNPFCKPVGVYFDVPSQVIASGVAVVWSDLLQRGQVVTVHSLENARKFVSLLNLALSEVLEEVFWYLGQVSAFWVRMGFVMGGHTRLVFIYSGDGRWQWRLVDHEHIQPIVSISETGRKTIEVLWGRVRMLEHMGHKNSRVSTVVNAVYRGLLVNSSFDFWYQHHRDFGLARAFWLFERCLLTYYRPARRDLKLAMRTFQASLAALKGWTRERAENQTKALIQRFIQGYELVGASSPISSSQNHVDSFGEQRGCING